MSTSSGDRGALDDVRVIDLGTYIAGSWAPVLMGEMGADVIKVEPLTGDPSREVGPYIAGESRFFLSLNRNKRGIAVDARTDQGRELIYDLVRGADIVTDNYRPGVAERLGFDYDSLRSVNPKIIHCSTSGFGSEGPIHERPAFDGILQAMGGIAANNGLVTGRPAQSAVLMVDFTTGLLSLGAILAALHHRQSTGEGQQIETSLLQSAMMLQPYSFLRPLEVEEEGPAGGYPYRVFETADGHLFVGSAQNKFWLLLCKALGLEEMGEDPDLSTNRGRVERALEISPRLEECFKTRPSAEWEEILAKIGVPSGPVLTTEELFDHPQVEAMNLRQSIDHSTIGPMHVHGSPFRLHGTPASIQRAAPSLGEHTDEVLGEIGIAPDRIESLRSADVIA